MVLANVRFTRWPPQDTPDHAPPPRVATGRSGFLSRNPAATSPAAPAGAGLATAISQLSERQRPAIQAVPTSQLERATGLSRRYIATIRRGERTPHPRHWREFVRAAEGG